MKVIRKSLLWTLLALPLLTITGCSVELSRQSDDRGGFYRDRNYPYRYDDRRYGYRPPVVILPRDHRYTYDRW